MDGHAKEELRFKNRLVKQFAGMENFLDLKLVMTLTIILLLVVTLPVQEI